jgi:predicted ester cyclase
MQGKDPEKIAMDYMQVWNAGNENILDTLASKHLEVSYTHFEKVYKGIDAYKEALRTTYSYFPDIRINVREVFLAGDTATVIWTYTGTHKSGNLFGFEPSGTPVNVSGITILEIAEGLVSTEKGIVDNLALLMQLGLFNKPEGKK